MAEDKPFHCISCDRDFSTKTKGFYPVLCRDCLMRKKYLEVDKIKLAIRLVKQVHTPKFIDEHLRRVLEIAMVSIKDQIYNFITTYTVIWLHDIIEDTDVTYSDIKFIFGEEIADYVNELTHEPSIVTGRWCFPRLESPLAQVIKHIDICANLSGNLVKHWTKERLEKYFPEKRAWRTA